MNGPTKRAPHIWENVRENTWPSWRPLGRKKASVTSQATMMEVPPMPGTNSKATSAFLCEIEEIAAVANLNGAYFGMLDQGPVQATTATNAVFGSFQLAVGKLLHFPLLLTPSLNSVGAEVGKPIAPQTASVGVSTSGFVRREGDVIRHNFGWTIAILAYLIVIGLFYYLVLPGAMS